MTPAVLIDDSALITNSNLLGNTWSRQTEQSGLYNGTLSTWKSEGSSDNTAVPPDMYLFFYGTDINVYGTMTNNAAANYTIDGTTLIPVQFPAGVSSGKTGINLFSLSGLTSSVSHLLNIYPQSGSFSIDYLTYIPSSNTPLSGVGLILDDGDPILQYSAGQWNHTTGDFEQGWPYNGTMTGTNIKGATMNLIFEGSDISIYGLLNEVDGRLAASFSVDGQPATNYTPFDGDQDSDDSEWQLSRQFFHQNLSPGQHSLLVTLTDVSQAQMLWIDSVVYEGATSTTLSGASSPGSGGSGNPNPPNPNKKGSSFPKAAIAGIVVAVFLLAVSLLFYIRRRRRDTRSLPVHNMVYAPIAPSMPPVPTSTAHSSPYALANVGHKFNEAIALPPYTHDSPPQDCSNSNLNFKFTPPPQGAQTYPALPISQGEGSNQVPMERPVVSSASECGYASMLPPLSEQTFYTYSKKESLIGLQWATVAAAASSPIPNGSSSMTHTAEVLKRSKSQGSMSKSSPSGYEWDTSPPSARIVPQEEGSMSNTVDGAKSAKDPPPISTGGRVDTPVNRAHEDGSDGVDQRARATDAAPAELPPAYNDKLCEH